MRTHGTSLFCSKNVYGEGRQEVPPGGGVDERAVRQALEERRVHRAIKDEAGSEAVAICTAARH